MDYSTLKTDSELLVPSSCYTNGRGGNSIKYIVLHHNAGKLSHSQVYSTFVKNGTSAHYNVDTGGTICRFVSDSNTAYHAGNWVYNQKSIGIEHCNTSAGTPWTIPDSTLEAGAHLTAALCVYYSLGKPVYGENVLFHQDLRATACPGEIASSQKVEYFERAQYWYGQMNSSSSSSSSSSSTSTSSSSSSSSSSSTKLDVDGYIGPKTVKRWQEILGCSICDGVFSNQYSKWKSILSYNGYGITSAAIEYYTSPTSYSTAVKKIQKVVGTTQDGYWGIKTVKALQSYVGVTVDGVLGIKTAKAVQTKLNKGSF